MTEVGATLRSYSVKDATCSTGSRTTSGRSGRGQVLAPGPTASTTAGTPSRVGTAAQRWTSPSGETPSTGWCDGFRGGSTNRAERGELACSLHRNRRIRGGSTSGAVRLEPDGPRRFRLRARNDSSVPAPFGIGFHPYLTVGIAIDDAGPADPGDPTSIERRPRAADRKRTGRRVGPDFTEPRSVGSMRLDTGYTDLVRGADGLARAFVARPDEGSSCQPLGRFVVPIPHGLHGRHAGSRSRDDDALLRSSQ